jgi:hypothetical protein
MIHCEALGRSPPAEERFSSLLYDQPVAQANSTQRPGAEEEALSVDRGVGRVGLEPTTLCLKAP